MTSAQVIGKATDVHGAEAKDWTDFTLKPDLAAAWEQPADLQSVTFKLRQGVTWHQKPPVDGRAPSRAAPELDSY